jgi:YHS domain-containing protein
MHGTGFQHFSHDRFRAGLSRLGLLPALRLTGSPALAEDPVYQSWLGVAIDGTDPVAYFDEGKPVEGSSDFEYKWMGARWRFRSSSSLARFKAEPERYAPQYGGYCAWAVSEGYTASSTPEAFRIVGDKLYLNYSLKVQKKWEGDIPAHVRSADENWPGVLE